MKKILYVDEDANSLKKVRQAQSKHSGVECHTSNSIMKAINDLGIDDYDKVIIGSNGHSLQELKDRSRPLLNFLSKFGIDFCYAYENSSQSRDDRQENDKVILKDQYFPSKVLKL